MARKSVQSGKSTYVEQLQACIFVLYIQEGFYYKDKFFKGTKISGVSCENLTAREAGKNRK